MPNSTIVANEISFQEMVGIINEFPLTYEFLLWLAKDDLVCQVLSKSLYANIYDLVVSFSIENLKIYTAGGQILLDKSAKKIREFLSSNEFNLTESFNEYADYDKKKGEDLLVDSSYTVISQLFYKGNFCGSCWEIFNLSNLILAYKKRRHLLILP